MNIDVIQAIDNGSCSIPEAVALLKDLEKRGIIDSTYVTEQLSMINRKEYLDKHPYNIYLGSDKNWHSYLPDDQKGRKAIKNKNKIKLEDKIIEYWMAHAPIEQKTTAQVCIEWLNYKLKYHEIYKQTYDRYMIDYRKFIEDTKVGNAFISSINECELEEFIRDTIIENNLSSKAYSGFRLLLLGTFKYAFKKNMTKINITNFFSCLDLSRKMFKKKVISDKDMVFTDNEVKRISEWIESHEISIISYGILLTFYTGLRCGELCALTHKDIDGNILRVNKTEIRYKDDDGKYIREVRNDAKTESGNREVILNDEAIRIIKKIISINPDGEYLFMRNGTRIHERAFTDKLSKICRQININHRSIHKARKTYATKLINSGVDESIILSQMGHTQLSTTKNYYYFNNSNLDEAKKQISSAIAY